MEEEIEVTEDTVEGWKKASERLIKMMNEELPWVTPLKPWRRCKAVKEPNPSGYYGRCELDRDHNYATNDLHHDHALERGFDVPRWSTKWTN